MRFCPEYQRLLKEYDRVFSIWSEQNAECGARTVGRKIQEVDGSPTVLLHLSIGFDLSLPQELSSSLVANVPQIKGFDFQKFVVFVRGVSRYFHWRVEALRIASELHETQWQARAEGELGIIALLLSNTASAVSMVAKAILSAYKTGDIGSRVRLLCAREGVQ